MSAREVKTLLYLAYGNARAVDEARFALLTTLHFTAGRADYRHLVYTDRPEAFSDLPVDVHPLDQTTLDLWAGPDRYLHRRKLMAVVDAMASATGPVVFLDGDTYLRRSPDDLFGRITPRQAVLHLPESRLLDSDSPAKHDLSAHVADRSFPTRSGRTLRLDANSMMWNSGVIGLHPSHAGLLLDALDLVDAVWAEYRGSHDLEQFAVGAVLERDLSVASSDDLVFHYWPEHLRVPFVEALPELLQRLGDLPLPERTRAAYDARPRNRGRARARMAAKRLLWHAGIATRGPRTSG